MFAAAAAAVYGADDAPHDDVAVRVFSTITDGFGSLFTSGGGDDVWRDDDAILAAPRKSLAVGLAASGWTSGFFSSFKPCDSLSALMNIGCTADAGCE